LATITIRVPDDMHAKIKKKAEQLGKSLNGYIADLLAADVGHNVEKTSTRDKIEVQLTNHITTNGYAMTYSQAMALFHLTYQQLYNRYKHLLIGDKKVEQAKTKAEDFKEKGKLSDHWNDQG
jgi:HicB-like protein involved in pilus formation